MDDLQSSVDARRFIQNYRAFIQDAGTVSYPATFRSYVKNPSSVLRLTLEAFLEFAGTGSFGYNQIVNFNATWLLRAMTPGSGAFGNPPLHFIISSADDSRLKNLPNSYEIRSYVDTIEVQGSVTNNPDNGVGGSILGFSWNLRAIWEPDPGLPRNDESDRYLHALFKRCNIGGNPTR